VFLCTRVMNLETVFTVSGVNLKFGAGATREIGFDVRSMGVRRVLVVTDPFLSGSEPVATTLQALRSEGIDTVLFDQVHIEPTDRSILEASQFASEGGFEGYVAVGGGSVIDTAKAANLFATYPARFLTYVNRPLGEAQPVPGPLRPLIAVPTTAGSSSESSGVIVFDLQEANAKTGISDRRLRPALAIVDPDNMRTMPPMVAACSGLDVLSPAIEAFTAKPFNHRPAPDETGLRPPYQGANPASDVWATKVIEMVGQHLIRAITDPSDEEARTQMALASTFGGLGVSSAGVHLPHAMAYPVSKLAKAKGYCVDGYPPGQPLVPHGMSVILNLPAVVRFTAPTNRERHLHAAHLMGADVSGADLEHAGELLADAVTGLMREAGIPDGLRAVGLGPEDIDSLVDGAVAQQRLISVSPRPVSREDLVRLFLDSMDLGEEGDRLADPPQQIV